MRSKNLTTLQITLKVEEREGIEAAALAGGLTVSAFLRSRLGLPALVRSTSPGAAARAGRLGGLARAAALSPEARSRIAAIGGSAKRERKQTHGQKH